MSSAVQTAVIQSVSATKAVLPLAVSHTVPIPCITSPYHVLVRIRTVGLNPTDHKMVTYFYNEGSGMGCDFCGIVEQTGPSALIPKGTRVCGAVFPYGTIDAHNGAFSQWVVADSRHLLQVPEDWTDAQGAALGSVGWATSCLSMSDPEALGLSGLPSKPVEKREPILVYGGATATGLITIQILKRSGYAPIAVCSSTSAPLVMKYGAVGTAEYGSKDCVEKIKLIAGGVPIRHAIDCITTAESAAVCFGALGRTGGRYVCLEQFQNTWQTRRAVRTKVVMGYEMQGMDVNLGHDVYDRKAKPELYEMGTTWVKEMQVLLDAKAIMTPPLRELQGGFEGIIDGLHILKSGEARGRKLVVRVLDS
ncbi:GroES-like protein [Annulohypoxylon maeteangense]|uniref:GroES-like protein n=1 Tax=Annulohypoxylon maeteangense TaxID=1927788 RepID=UPI00200767ED|nr:GroES-like protein [Annulohypoxylon maeteangense]KAI0889614.1 GroES-like protein [Annulohypoxylon maeteangense]